MERDNSEVNFRKGENREVKDFAFIGDSGDGIPLKRCYACNEDLPYSEFTGDAAQYDGTETKCRECKSKLNKKYYQDNRDYILKKRKQYYIENRERILEHKRQYGLKQRKGV